jgi:hypothetical protein
VSNVQSKPLINGEIEEKEQHAPSVRGGWYAVGLAAFAFGGPLWFVGARYTLDGWVYALNWLAAFIQIPGRLPVATGWASVVIFVALGLIYSRVEVHYFPLRRRDDRIIAAPWQLWVVYFLLIGTDLLTTALGVLFPSPTAHPAALAMAGNMVIAPIATVILTFLPEQLILFGLKMFRR